MTPAFAVGEPLNMPGDPSTPGPEPLAPKPMLPGHGPDRRFPVPGMRAG